MIIAAETWTKPFLSVVASPPAAAPPLSLPMLNGELQENNIAMKARATPLPSNRPVLPESVRSADPNARRSLMAPLCHMARLWAPDTPRRHLCGPRPQTAAAQGSRVNGLPQQVMLPSASSPQAIPPYTEI